MSVLFCVSVTFILLLPSGDPQNVPLQPSDGRFSALPTVLRPQLVNVRSYNVVFAEGPLTGARSISFRPKLVDFPPKVFGDHCPQLIGPISDAP